jgi:hypothetical protein
VFREIGGEAGTLSPEKMNIRDLDDSELRLNASEVAYQARQSGDKISVRQFVDKMIGMRHRSLSKSGSESHIRTQPANVEDRVQPDL